MIVTALTVALLASWAMGGTPAQTSCEPLAEFTFAPRIAGTVAVASPVQVGLSLTDPAQSIEYPEGVYEARIASSRLARFIEPALYIPAVGGLVSLQVNGERTLLPVADFAGVGPVIGLRQGDSRLQLEIAGDFSSYSGLWKSAPLLCERGVAIARQARDELWQHQIPAAMAVLCLGLAVLFFSIHLYTGRRFKNYPLFVAALLLWAAFFAVLSGAGRQLSYEFGTAALFPSRVAAALGLLLLFYSYRDGRFRPVDRIAVGLAALANLPAIYFGARGWISPQLYCLALTLPCQFPVVLDLLGQGRRSRRQLLIAVFASLTVAGEFLDLVKLLGPGFGVSSSLPYLARLTLPPTLFFSAAYFLWQFVRYFRESELNDFRHRILGRLALRLSLAVLNEATLFSIVRAARRIIFARRVSVARRGPDGSYEVRGTSGFEAAAIGSALALDRFPHIAEAVRKGVIRVTEVTAGFGKRYRDGFSMAIPIPMRADPEYLILLSDIKAGHSFSENGFNLCRQFYTTVSGALIATQEREKSETRERAFQQLVRKLDPSLFEFIQRNVDDGNGTVDETCERGVVFFDQKSFTTMVERVHPDDLAAALKLVKQWVTRCAFRHNARMKGFYGDAFVIEVYPLLNEEKSRTILRTSQLVWDLSEEVELLNRELVVSGFLPVAYRFGAHYGVAANIDVDLIFSGHTTLVGDAVNLSQRIQAKASPGEVYVSGAIAEAAEGPFLFNFIDNTYVKGRTGLVSLYRLIGKRSVESGAA